MYYTIYIDLCYYLFMGRSVLEFSYKRRRALRNRILSITCFIFILLLLSTVLFKYIIFPVRIDSDSMYPCAEENSFVIVSPVSSYSRGDAIIVEPMYSIKRSVIKNICNAVTGFFTFQQYRPFSSSDLFTERQTLRRVVGFPGDTIYMKDYVLYIKPADSAHFLTEFELSDKEYDIYMASVPDDWDKSLGLCGVMPEKKLGTDEYFVLCDNRVSGLDSRIWGAVSQKNIAGKALLQYFPFNKFGLM